MKKWICVSVITSLIFANLQGALPIEIKAANTYSNRIEESKTITDVSKYENNEMIVVYKEGVKKKSIKACNVPEDGVEMLTEDAVMFSLESKEEVEDTLAILQQDEAVEYVQPNYTYYALDTEVNDTNFASKQWALYNNGSLTVNSVKSVAGIDINIEEAWELWDKKQEEKSTSKDVVVAVIDTGIKYDHEELADSIWVNEKETLDGKDTDGNGYIDDINGWNFYNGNNQIYNQRSKSEDAHGTHGAGTIVAKRNNYIGIAGIASNGNVKIMPLKVLGGKDGSGSTDDLVKAIAYAEENGASICNLSLGTEEEDELVKEQMQESNMLFVVAAGNGEYKAGNYTGYSIDDRPMYPASYSFDNIISVGNVQCNGVLNSSSNYGVRSVQIAAPGTYIYSTSTSTDGYEFMTGTSMAAPMVTGVAAMIYAYYEDISLDDVKDILLGSVQKVSGLETKIGSGGIVDAYAALTYCEGKATEIPQTEVPPTEIPPTEEPTEEPYVTETPTSTPLVTKIPTSTPYVTQEPTSTPLVTEAPSSTPYVTKEPTSTPLVTKAPSPTPYVTQEPTSTPLAIKTPSPTPYVTETPTATPFVSNQPLISIEPTESPQAIQTTTKSVTLYMGQTYVTDTQNDFTWKSSDSTVATVNSAGKVTTKKEGNVTITGSSKYKKLIYKLKVKKVTLKQPSNLKVKITKKQKSATVKLSWKKVSNATGYIIYRAVGKNGSFKKVKTITKSSVLSYTDKSLGRNKKYYYKIKAYKSINKVKSYSIYSKIKLANIK